jgi:hypothetical protein
MQAAEYRERLQHGAAVAAEAMQNGAAGNGSTPAAAGNGAAPSDERAATVS